MGAVDERVGELLDRWLASVELHARYLDLDDAAYARVQDWPRHQRPTRWVVDLARARLLELKRQLVERQARRDTSFAESLELMAFLTNLLGSDNLERFIPLAVEPKVAVTPPSAPAAAAAAAPDATMLAPALVRSKVAPPAADATLLAPALGRTKAPPQAARPPSKNPAPDATVLAPALGRAKSPPPAADATVLAPALGRAKSPPPAADATVRAPALGRAAPPAPARTPRVATPADDATLVAPALGRSKPPPGPTTATPAARGPEPAAGKTDAIVVADAVRFLRWGRDWSQLAGLIARLASRPAEEDVAKILRRHRAEIETRARERD